MIRNSNSVEIDAFILSARPEPKFNESNSNMLTGAWFVQTIGEPAEVLKVRIVCKWDVVQEVMLYSTTKERLSVEFLDFNKTGVILNVPTYDIGERHETNPTYVMTFDLAVIPDV